MTYKAVAMLSGGLDSRLAVRLMQEQGIELMALNYVTPFCTCTAKSSCRMEARKAADEYGFPVKVIFLFDEFMEAVRRPRFGYGSGINPCLDCRILMFKKAKELMAEIGASFVVTGEVVGERPMSQRLDAMRTIERESGLSGLIVRPLSARLLEPTVPEQEGWIDREKLLAISGRSRKPQMALAEKLGVKDYPCPAGGCLLTDQGFAARLRGLLDQCDTPSRNDVYLLKVGRHFPLADGRIVVGRNEKENVRIEALARDGDWLVKSVDVLGPATLVRGRVIETDLERAALLTARYGQGREHERVNVESTRLGGEDKRMFVVGHPLRSARELRVEDTELVAKA